MINCQSAMVRRYELGNQHKIAPTEKNKKLPLAIGKNLILSTDAKKHLRFLRSRNPQL